MKIKDIMVTDVTAVFPDTSISDVSDILYKNRFHGVPVVENGRVIGIVTEDDFFLKSYDDLYLPAYVKFLRGNRIASNLPEEIKEKISRLLQTKTSDLMTKDCVTINPEADISELMDLMKRTKFTTFPVTDRSQNLLGIVTLSDILGIVKRGSREMAKAFSGEIKSREVDALAQELDNLWRDKLVIISMKQVRTWQGSIVIAFAAGVAATIAWMMIMKTI